MKNIVLVIVFSTLTSCALFSPNPNRDSIQSSAPLELKPFTSDYCTDWPDGTHDDPKQWRGCCFTHDLHYWIGGTELERKNADKELRECVKISGAKIEGFFMYIGVRMAGRPGNASYSWGYGWTIKRDYQDIPSNDIEQAKKLLGTSIYNQEEDTQKLIHEFIDNFLNKKI